MPTRSEAFCPWANLPGMSSSEGMHLSHSLPVAGSWYETQAAATGLLAVESRKRFTVHVALSAKGASVVWAWAWATRSAAMIARLGGVS